MAKPTRAAVLMTSVLFLAGCASSHASSTSERVSGDPSYRSRPASTAQVGGGTVSVFPAPGTLTASPRSEISVRGVAPGDVGPIQVVGSRSGRHTGRLVAHRDGHGASFVPTKPFATGETVRVTTRRPIRGVAGRSYTFRVLRPAPDTPAKSASSSSAPSWAGKPKTFISRPDIAISRVRIDKGAPVAAGGLIFVSPRRGNGMDGLELLDADAQLVWFRPLQKGVGATDLRVQTYRGQPVLTWWEGKSAGGHGYGLGHVLDTHYRPVATVRAGNGYQADLHELELTTAGTAFLTIYRAVRWDLSAVGGPANGSVLDCVVQEVEVGTGRVLFEWHSLGAVPLADSYQEAPKAPNEAFDFFHVNSVSSDADGELLVSGRATHTLYELDPRTAKIEERIGGKRSTFDLGAGVSFHSQHDAKWIGPATISLFDNGAGVGGDRHSSSRAIVLAIDATTRKATLRAAFAEPHGQLFASQGNVQALPNGDWFVGWGEGSYATQFAPNGRVRADYHYASGSSYRAYRFAWTGLPLDRPRAAASTDGARAVSVSWNGATAVARWQLLTGATAAALAATGRPVVRTGFETTITVPAGANVAAVRALDASGRTLGTSNAVVLRG